MSKILWIDTETTGLSDKKHGIISIAAIIDIDGKAVESFEMEMKPTGRFCDDGALQVNGYTRQQISRFTPWEQVLPVFMAKLNFLSRKYYSDLQFTLGGQNIPFDNRFVRSWCGGAVEYWEILVDQKNMIDTQKISKQFPELESHKLGDLCRAFGITLSNAHNAMADIEATRSLYYAMLDRVEKEKQMELM